MDNEETTTFDSEIKELVKNYGVDASDLDISLAIEVFRDIRNYPSSFDEETILSDLEKNKAKIAMAVIELDAKVGVEGQTAHSDNGINRTYGTTYIKAYENVVGYARIL